MNPSHGFHDEAFRLGDFHETDRRRVRSTAALRSASIFRHLIQERLIPVMENPQQKSPPVKALRRFRPLKIA